MHNLQEVPNLQKKKAEGDEQWLPSCALAPHFGIPSPPTGYKDIQTFPPHCAHVEHAYRTRL